MRLALLQLDTTVGDLGGNAALLAGAARRAAQGGAALAVASELCLTGYPPRDLLLQQGFVERAWAVAGRLAQQLAAGPPLLIGLPEPNDRREGRPLYNAAALLQGGRVARVFRKTLLPTYDVFDEDRYFEPAAGAQILSLEGRRFGVSVCEDIWNDRDYFQRRRYHVDPIEELVADGADCILNLSASPFTVGKQAHREAMLAATAGKYGLPVVYVNQVGGDDELVFDGRSLVVDAGGRVVLRAAAFAEDVALADLERPLEALPPVDAEEDWAEHEVWQALVLGTRDYVRKSGFSSCLLGLSGGIDSALVAAVAAEALGPRHTLCVLLPSPFSSEGSVSDARLLAERLGVRTLTLPIEPIMSAFDDTLRAAFAGRERDVTEENIQARIRGNLLMALSNKYGSLLLTTGNKSELAVGYCTIYGDMSGGLAVISDVPKTMVYRLARWLSRRAGEDVIPAAILTKPPSAELRPGQTDQDSLPPYEVLDEVLERFVERRESAEQIVEAGFDASAVTRVLRLVRAAEFKRKQAAPGIKVTDRAFGMGWRMPIATVPRAERGE